MTPNDINDLFDAEDAATPEEAAATEQDLRTDPELARALLQSMFARAGVDRDFAVVVHLFVQGTMMQWIVDRAARDDAFALQCGNRMADILEQTKPGWRQPPPRPQPHRQPTPPRRESRAERKAKKVRAA